MKDYERQVAVITGAGRGIGRGIALYCAQQGMKIVLAGIGMESLTKTNADLEALGAETLIVQTDVSRFEAVENLAKKSFEAFGSVDLLVNNAGVMLSGKILDHTLDDWNWLMGVNFYGVLYGIKAFMPHLIAQEQASRIVNVASVAGILHANSMAAYSISKHAVVLLTESVYKDLANRAPHVGISVYCPGYVDTELDRVDQSRPERFKNDHTEMTDEDRVRWRETLSKGFTIEKSAEVLFEGLKENKLYIGPKAFAEQLPELAPAARKRIENILGEINPGT